MKNNKNLEKIILDKIKAGEVVQKPKSFFVIKNFVFWSLSALFVSLGAVSFASILHKISGDFETIKKIVFEDLSFFENILFFIPFFWTFLLGFFLYFAVKNYKKTNFFYRINMEFVVLITVNISIILGILLFNFGVAQKAENISEKYLPFYDKYTKIQKAKRDIFIRKMKELGITQEILDENPEIKNRVAEKFDQNVLGKKYFFKKPEVCEDQIFSCAEDQLFFEDQKGCGCRQVHANFEK